MATTTFPAHPTPGAPELGPRVMVFANLLPDTIVDARRAGQSRRRILFCLAVLLVVLVGWYGLALLQTSNAKDDLSKAQRQQTALTRQQHKYGALVTAQTEANAISVQLRELMSGDLQWADLFATLRKSGGGQARVTSVSGVLDQASAGTSPGSPNSGQSVLNKSGQQQVGSLTITGSAASKNAVAGYVDALAKVKGLAAPYPANVTAAKGGSVTFSVSVLITTDALGGRFTPPSTAPTTSGGH